MGKKIEVAPETFVFLGIIVLLLPLGWWTAALFAALFHEFCHGLMVLAFGGKIQKITVNLSGIRMDTTPLLPGQRMISSLAGPVGGFLLLLTARVFPRLAVCGLLQSGFNLLPMLPLDGGRAIRAGLELFLSEELAERITQWIGNGTMAMLFILGCVSFLHFGSRFFLFLLGIFLFRCLRDRKTTCKEGSLRVQ